MIVRPIFSWLLPLLMLMHTLTTGSAQKSGRQDYPNLGISFTIPDGWVGQETNDGMIIGHQTIPGVIIMNTHTYRTIEELKEEAKTGLQADAGTQLLLAGTPGLLDNQAVEAHYEGTLQWEPAKAYAIGVLNTKGAGVLLMAIANKSVYQSELENTLRRLRKSLVFSAPKTGPIVEQWKSLLQGTRLTYMESYTSGSSYDGGIGGGYSSDARIDLCSQGYFKFASNSSVGVGGAGVSGYAGGNDNGAGTWTIEAPTGVPLLVLTFNGGEVQQYQLTSDGDKIFLNGRRYFRTTSGEYAPDCP
ncbi:MAG: hypothetical protein KDC28_03785 [Saprospiraceae bacterium]|nr:hypothetical protein [Saprospiraceae bacterium]MCB9319535.1 hypothetical protein [Lewinellaceae bacterium]